jgi:hypothetical protein
MHFALRARSFALAVMLPMAQGRAPLGHRVDRAVSLARIPARVGDPLLSSRRRSSEHGAAASRGDRQCASGKTGDFYERARIEEAGAASAANPEQSDTYRI